MYGVPLRGTLIPVKWERLRPHDLITSHRLHLLIASNWGLGFNMHLEATQTFRPQQPPQQKTVKSRHNVEKP